MPHIWYNKLMSTTPFSKQDLNKLSKDALIAMYLQMGENFALLSAQSKAIQAQNELLLRQIEDLKEQVAILVQNRFGKKTEAGRQIAGQLAFDLENACILNEAEVLTESGLLPGAASRFNNPKLQNQITSKS